MTLAGACAGVLGVGGPPLGAAAAAAGAAAAAAAEPRTGLGAVSARQKGTAFRPGTTFLPGIHPLQNPLAGPEPLLCCNKRSTSPGPPAKTGSHKLGGE